MNNNNEQRSSKKKVKNKDFLENVKNKKYLRADDEFKKKFLNNPFGHTCHVCDRLWFLNDLHEVPSHCFDFLSKEFPSDNISDFKLCPTCYQSICKRKQIPYLSKSNGFVYPAFPNDLPELDLITERLISPRLPFMQLRRLRYEYGSSKIVGQVINIPVDVNNMISKLPRNIDDDYSFNVHIKTLNT